MNESTVLDAYEEDKRKAEAQRDVLRNALKDLRRFCETETKARDIIDKALFDVKELS